MSEVLRNEAASEKRERALGMHLAGATYQQIADRLGYASRSGAHAAVQEALNERVGAGEVVDAYRAEATRIDVLIGVLTGPMRAGDLGAVDRYMRAIERRTQLAALISQHMAPDVEGRVKTPLDELADRRARGRSRTSGAG